MTANTMDTCVIRSTPVKLLAKFTRNVPLRKLDKSITLPYITYIVAYN